MRANECTTISLGFAIPDIVLSCVSSHRSLRLLLACKNRTEIHHTCLETFHGETPMFGCFFSKVSCIFSPQNQSSAYKVHVKHLVLSDTWFYLMNIPFEVLFNGNSVPWAKWLSGFRFHFHGNLLCPFPQAKFRCAGRWDVRQMGGVTTCNRHMQCAS